MNPYKNGCAFIDDEFVPIELARIPILDWGFLHSDATYDVVHVWEGKFFRIDDHLDRFYASMQGLRMQLDIDREQIRTVLTECVRRSELRSAYVEMGCTRGMPEPGSRDPRTCENRFFAFAIPFVWIADPHKQAQGLNLIISQRQRISPRSVDPRIKNYHWLDMVMALFDAYDVGGDTAATVDDAGNLVEGPGFNIFCLKDKQLRTPGDGILHGITRGTVIELAQNMGLEVKATTLAASAVREADEVFLSSTGGGVIAVAKVDGQSIGKSLPGPVTAQLQAAYWALHDDPGYGTVINYD